MIESTEIIASILLGLAVVHSFCVGRFQHWAKNFKEGSVLENLLHMLGEIEVAFGLWAALLIALLISTNSYHEAVIYLNSRDFTEPSFVFVILALCSTKPILEASEHLIWGVSRLFSLIPSLSKAQAFLFATLIIGPLSGSFITEPAAMTVTALIILKYFFSGQFSTKFKYATLGTLFVNVSVGGTLTNYAAPPVLMVADAWGLTLSSTFFNYGLKGLLACLITTTLLVWRFSAELKVHPLAERNNLSTPWWLQFCHLCFLALVVLTGDDIIMFAGVFLFFMAFVTVTSEYQSRLRLREGLLVAMFLGSLIILSGLQSWWLEPLLASLSDEALFFGAMGLSSIADNAAITYLGSLMPALTEPAKYALLSGAVCGGGLTVIANAPNPAGFSLLSPAFGDEGAEPIKLTRAALVPTMIAAACYLLI